MMITKIIVFVLLAVFQNEVNAKHTTAHSIPILKRDKHGKINPANSIVRVYSHSFTKKCTASKGSKKSCVFTLKHRQYCVLHGAKAYCRPMQHGERLKVNCTIGTAKGGSAQCNLIQTCAYSEKDKGLICSNSNVVSKKLCAGKHCYEVDDLQELEYKASCSKKDTCTIGISKFCVKSGKCYASKGSKTYVSSGNVAKCTQVALTSASAARIHVLCKKQSKKAVCNFSIFLEVLRSQLNKEVRKSCHIPHHLRHCGANHTQLQAQKCTAKIDACKTKRKCLRNVYIGCVAEVYLNKFYCESKGVKPVYSTACVGVIKEDVKCLLVYDKCEKLKSEKEKRKCFKELEMTCGLVASRYIACSARPLKGNGKGGEISSTKVNCKELYANYASCNKDMMKCMVAENNNQRTCMKESRATCVKKIEMYHMYKYKCVT